MPREERGALVSVAIPAYNHAAFIEDCLASVCAQTYPELELVLIDDGSKDDTLEVARRFLEPRRGRFRRIVLERQENQGVSAASNAAIAACRGEWVHLLGSDDVLHSNKIERIQQAIADWDCADLALVHADADMIDRYGHPVDGGRLRRPRPEPGPERGAWSWLFFNRQYIFNPTLALRREAVLSIGGFDATLALEDLDCWLRLSTRYAFARVPEVLASYRKHPGNSSRRRVRMLGALFQTYGKFLAEHPDLIAEADIRRHFRRNLKRFWRRMRGKQPGLLPLVIGAWLRSHLRTPQPEDYRRFGRLLDGAAG
ncbi:MAG: glycosyltransferase [Rhodocyclaceae bacterium]|nr:glycosyltransferase [Rhodocyclaceae bacterium]MCO5096225.1 glycosyltransferase [Rhodocyclaceae bacterium]